jgi:hypothetical protein
MCRMNQTGSRYSSLTGSCECGNERSGSIKGWELLVFCSAIISRSRTISMHLYILITQDRQCTYNVNFNCVRIGVVAVANQ